MKTYIQLKILKDSRVLVFKDINGNLLDCESFNRIHTSYIDMADKADKFEKSLKEAGVI